jgi:hypothetical protein
MAYLEIKLSVRSFQERKCFELVCIRIREYRNHVRLKETNNAILVGRYLEKLFDVD